MVLPTGGAIEYDYIPKSTRSLARLRFKVLSGKSWASERLTRHEPKNVDDPDLAMIVCAANTHDLQVRAEVFPQCFIHHQFSVLEGRI